jgi:small subunit ribosomal protein S5
MTEENIINVENTENVEVAVEAAPEVQTEVIAEAVAEVKAPAAAPIAATPVKFAPRAPFVRGGARPAAPLGKDGKPMRGPRKFGGGKPERVKLEFEQKTLDVRRVTRVVSGGRRFSFSVAVVIGDRKGRVGLGLGKAGDTSLAIDKAYKQAQKKMVQLKLTKDNSIPHEMSAKYNASRIDLMPNKGRGLIAGSSARTVFALAGIQNITAKLHSGSKNKLNNARVAIKVLESISAPYDKKNRKEGDIPMGGSGDRRPDSRGPRREAGAGTARAPRANNFFVKRTVETKKENTTEASPEVK